MGYASDYANNSARIIESSAAAQAEAQRQKGHLWGSTIAGIGQMVADIPKQRADAERIKLQDAELKDKQAERQDARAAQKRANEIVAALPKKPDGTYDTSALMQSFAAGNVPLPEQTRVIKLFEDFNGIVTSQQQSQRDHLADIANLILTHAKQGDPLTADSVHLGFAAAKSLRLATDDDESQLVGLLEQGTDPKQLLETVRGLGSKYKQEKPPADYTLNQGDVRLSGTTNQPLASNPKPAGAANAVNAGSFEDYVLRYATEKGKKPEQITTAEIEQLRKKYQQADDRPPINIRMGNGMTPGQAFEATRQLRNDFNRETTAARTVAQQLALMKSSIAAVKKGDSTAGSQGVLVTFQKILDPTSVVRESEYARSASGLSLMGRIEGAWDKIKQGGAGVTVKDLEQFVTLAEQFTRNQQAFATQSREQINSIAKEYGLKPDNITRDVSAPAEAAPPPAAATAPAATPTIGSIVTFQGKRYRVKDIKNKQAVLEPLP